MAIKTRTKKTSPNTAGPNRRAIQEAAAKRNRIEIANAGQFSIVVTPWEISKAKRLNHRKLAGKTYENWLKKSAKASKYKDNGKHAIKVDTTKVNHSQRDDRRNTKCVAQPGEHFHEMAEYADGVLTGIGRTS